MLLTLTGELTCLELSRAASVVGHREQADELLGGARKAEWTGCIQSRLMTRFLRRVRCNWGIARYNVRKPAERPEKSNELGES